MINIPENIIFLKGDVLKTETDIVCHQVNCKAVMGAGIAKQIRALYPELYDGYVKYSRNLKCGPQLLGHVYFYEADKYVIANCYGQNTFGRTGVHTNYFALETCFKTVKEYSEQHNLKTIAMPYNIGCGLAGGDWNVVLDMIIKVFKNSNLTVKIVEWVG